MALAESIEYDKIEVVGTYKNIQIRQSVIVKKDGVEIARSYNRSSLNAGTLDASDNLVDTDISAEPAEVQAICTAVWTDTVKAAWKTKLIADKSA